MTFLKLCIVITEKDPCGPLPSCPRPPFGSCFGFTYNIINGVKCISGCSFGCPQVISSLKKKWFSVKLWHTITDVTQNDKNKSKSNAFPTGLRFKFSASWTFRKRFKVGLLCRHLLIFFTSGGHVETMHWNTSAVLYQQTIGFI